MPNLLNKNYELTYELPSGFLFGKCDADVLNIWYVCFAKKTYGE